MDSVSRGAGTRSSTLGCVRDLHDRRFTAPVSEETICAAIRDDGLGSSAEIGKALEAGTNCGTCIPEIKKLLASQLLFPVA